MNTSLSSYSALLQGCWLAHVSTHVARQRTIKDLALGNFSHAVIYFSLKKNWIMISYSCKFVGKLSFIAFTIAGTKKGRAGQPWLSWNDKLVSCERRPRPSRYILTCEKHSMKLQLAELFLHCGIRLLCLCISFDAMRNVLKDHVSQNVIARVYCSSIQLTIAVCTLLQLW